MDVEPPDFTIITNFCLLYQMCSYWISNESSCSVEHYDSYN